jgi:hypothetical protein
MIYRFELKENLPSRVGLIDRRCSGVVGPKRAGFTRHAHGTERADV